MVRYARKKDIRTRIHTNGTVLTPELSCGLIVSGLDLLSVSFDGYDQEMYDVNRPNAGFDRVLGNITDFLTFKKNLGSKTPFTAIELMEITDDPPDIVLKKRRDFLKRFDGLPLDKFILRKPHNWGGLLDTGPVNPAAKRIACPLLWHALVVLWDGKVLPCPQDFFGVLELGNVNNQTLDEIWNGEAIKNLRREMADTAHLSKKPCVDCDRIMRSTIAGIPTDYLGRFVSENILSNNWLGKILPH